MQGIVRDASSAVLPGVRVEVSSPVLIDKTRGYGSLLATVPALTIGGVVRTGATSTTLTRK